MDLYQMRNMPKIFNSSSRYYGFTYYHNPAKAREVCLEYNLYGDAQFLLSYELIEDKGVFILLVQESMTDSIADRIKKPECKVAGKTEKKALEFMIKKILEKPARNKENGVDLMELKSCLRQALLPKAA